MRKRPSRRATTSGGVVQASGCRQRRAMTSAAVAITGRRRSCVPYRRSTGPMRPRPRVSSRSVFLSVVSLPFGFSLEPSMSRSASPVCAFRVEGQLKMTIDRVGGLIVLVLGLSAAEAPAQERQGAASAAPERRLSLEGGRRRLPDPLPRQRANGRRRVCADAQPDTARRRDALVPVPRPHRATHRRVRLLNAAARSSLSAAKCATHSSRVGVCPPTCSAVSAEARSGTGASTSSFRTKREWQIHVIYYGGGVRIPVQERLDAFGRYASDHGGRSQVRLFFCSDSRARRRLIGVFAPRTRSKVIPADWLDLPDAPFVARVVKG